MSLGRGGADRQKPHHEDEVYYVVRGQGRMRVGSEDHEVTAGSIIFVEAELDHGFHDREEELVTLVFLQFGLALELVRIRYRPWI